MKRRGKDNFDSVFILIFIFISIMGVFLGVMAVDKGTDAIGLIRGDSPESNNIKEFFIWSFLSKVIFILPSYIGGLSIFLTPLLLISVYLKAYSYGFTAGGVVALFGFSGFIDVLTGVFFQNFLFLSALNIYSAFALGKNMHSYLNRRNYDYVKKKNIGFIKATVLIFLLSAVLSVIESILKSKLTIYTL